MNSITSNVDVEKLRDMYQKDPVAKLVFDYWVTRVRNRTVTSIDSLLSSLASKGQEISRPDVIRFLRQLQELDCGSFVTGRKGHPSRFNWRVGLTSISNAAAGKDVTLVPITENHKEEADDDLLCHTFFLRPDLPVTIHLPPDFSSAEASRLADFIKALPFQTGG